MSVIEIREAIESAIAQAAQLRSQERWAEASDVSSYADSLLIKLDSAAADPRQRLNGGGDMRIEMTRLMTVADLMERQINDVAVTLGLQIEVTRQGPTAGSSPAGGSSAS